MSSFSSFLSLYSAASISEVTFPSCLLPSVFLCGCVFFPCLTSLIKFKLQPQTHTYTHTCMRAHSHTPHFPANTLGLLKRVPSLFGSGNSQLACSQHNLCPTVQSSGCSETRNRQALLLQLLQGGMCCRRLSCAPNPQGSRDQPLFPCLFLIFYK